MKKHQGVVATVVIVGGVVGVLYMIRQAQRRPGAKTYPGGAYKIRNMGPERWQAPVPGIGYQAVSPKVRKVNDGAYAPVYPLTRAFSAPGF